jgi:hypothetical protein
MPEATSNVEFAHKIHEQGHEHHPPPGDDRFKWISIAEAIVLAIVAVATAWSGYQASRWDALSAKDYALASRTNVLSQERATLAGQDRLYDVTTFNGWIAAKVSGRAKLASFFERRFRPEFALAYSAWWKLDPVNNPSAPPGPTFMPQYKSSNARDSAKLGQEASRLFESGVVARETGDDYVRVTVLLATVLLLTALSQRFELFAPRVAVVALAVVLLVVSTYSLLTHPRA